MTELLPSLQAERIRSSLVDYLTTTFALADADARRSLAEFLTDRETSIFKGPFVRTRLPFAPAPAGWERLLSWPLPYTPYRHQAEAFARLRSVDDLGNPRRPLPTLVTTGTGSGKTESFLFPILDHVVRAKRAGQQGVKALILYPMNALANDQAARLATLITSQPELGSVTAGLYTGQDTVQRTKVTSEGLITDRSLMRSAPPDILLTNYKMLDQLLLRHEDANIWKLSATSLQYLVLDEFHTYDGAQGTDVAMLLRRLGLTLKAWAPPLDDADRQRPLGRITPVATSATLGDEGDPSAMIDFASTVFGEAFDESMVVTESRLSLEQWSADAVERCRAAGLSPATLRNTEVRELAATLAHVSDVEDMTARVLEALWDLPAGAGLPAGLNALDLVRAHPLVHRLVERTVHAVHEDELLTALLPGVSGREAGGVVLAHLLATLSHVRASFGLEALSVTLHLWVRELTRIDRTAESSASYRWSDDGVHLSASEDVAPSFPAIYCRHCGRSGWGVELAPEGSSLAVTDTEIRTNHAAKRGRFRALLYAPGEADAAVLGEDAAGPQAGPLEGLRWFHTRQRVLLDSPPADDDPALREGHVLPVLTHVGTDADALSRDDVCPSCQQHGGIRFLGSAIATLLSVTLSTLFGDPELDAAEKKALVFTDSVQDAAHRAGFVEARSHSLTLRAVLRGALGQAPKTLEELVDQAIRDAGDDIFARYRLLPPSLVEHKQFRAFWEAETLSAVPAAVRTRVRRRLLFDASLEVGLLSRVGRTLEATGAVAVHVEAGPPTKLVSIARKVVQESSGQDTLDGHLAGLDDATLLAWVRGVLERMRERGGLYHEWLQGYLRSDGSRYRIWGGRPKDQGMPAFPKGRSAPAFPRVGASKDGKDQLLDPVTSAQSWYSRWAARTLGVQPGYAGLVAKQLFHALAQGDVLRAHSADSGATIYSIPTDAVVVHPVDLDALTAGEHLLVCEVCRHQMPGTRETVDQLDGAPCVLTHCPGRMHRTPGEDNFYRHLYASADMRRIVAREHSSLLDDKTRLGYETAFKSADANPEAPNVLVATPTLEMGIDIGDLSTVVLASLPRTVASYVQRVGRAGRLTGNALDLAFVTGRGEHLPRIGDPLSVINGQVRPPATYLSAEEILKRQYIAHLVDAFARDPQRPHPQRATAAIGTTDKGSFLDQLIEYAESEPQALLDTFLTAFTGVDDDVAAMLRAWATPGQEPRSSGLARHLMDAAARWRTAFDELKHRLAHVEKVLPELTKVAETPGANDDDRAAAKSAEATRNLYTAQLKHLRGEHWIGVLEAFGVLPNYTLLDEVVTLDVDLTWIDPDTGEYQSEDRTYERAAATALTELAPGAVFYARGTEITIDSVDLGPEGNAVRTWAHCAQCGFASQVTPTEPAPSVCPRCGHTEIADTGQQFKVVELERVSANVRRDEAAIDDSHDTRQRRQFNVVVAADIDPTSFTHSWFVDGLDFGVTHLRRLTVRWLNTGRRSEQGTSSQIAGAPTPMAGFRLCSYCGHLDQATGKNEAREHKAWCIYRTSAEEKTVDVLLSRTLRTEGLLIRLPSSVTTGDNYAEDSLKAAILLGLREAFGGAPDHIGVEVVPKPVATTGAGGTTARALLLHDTVPGGTGYLAGLATPEGLWKVLHLAWRTVSTCACGDEERLACHRCLLPFAGPAPDRVSRRSAERHLAAILAGKQEAPEGWEPPAAPAWQVTSEEPANVGSPLELQFRKAFEERIKLLGNATIQQVPGHHGNTLKITLSGGERKWSLTPEVPLGGVQPDFVLRSDDPNVPPVAIFCDGWQYHASPAHNRIADDAQKRHALRYEKSEPYVVLSVTEPDLNLGGANVLDLGETASQVVLELGYGFSPTTLATMRGGVLDMLVAWIQSPDPAAMRGFAEALPWYFGSNPSQMVALGDTPVERVATQVLEGTFTPAEGAPDGWVADLGGLVVVARAHDLSARPISVELAAVLDDRPEALTDPDHRKAWRTWLAILNASNLRVSRTVVTALSLVTDQIGVAAATPRSTTRFDLSHEWQTVLELAQGEEEEGSVLHALAEAGVPVPELGAEVEDGIPLDLSWPTAKVVFDLSLDPDTRHELERAGWSVVSDAESARAALVKEA
jgi:ATP-dependent helicase YprA (DUF1998 family)